MAIGPQKNLNITRKIGTHANGGIGLNSSTSGRPTASAFLDLPIRSPMGTADRRARAKAIEMRFKLAKMCSDMKSPPVL
jgi:hypothetical protein